jgi:hypothetical protein
LIVNYRRIFQVAFKVKKNDTYDNREAMIVDFAKESYPRISEEDGRDGKIVFSFYYPEALLGVIENIVRGKINSEPESFRKYTAQFYEMNGDFLYLVRKDFMPYF